MTDRSERPSRGPRRTGPRPAGPRKSFGGESDRAQRGRDEGSGERRPPRASGGRDDARKAPRRPGAGGRPARPAADRPARSASGDARPARPRDDQRSAGPRRPGAGGRPARPAPDREERSSERSTRPSGGTRRTFGDKPTGFKRKNYGQEGGNPAQRRKRAATDDTAPTRGEVRPRYRLEERPRRDKKNRTPERKQDDDGRIRLNRYLAQSGVASRREADELIKAGVVSVNGKVVTELGTKIAPTDKVHYGGQRLSREQLRYVLLNKPKDFITTTDDPRERRTVMALVESACTERLYPVGRLDRNTTGVLLLTNDGDLAKKLTHPSHGAEKIYHVTLDKAVTKADLDQLVEGVPLDDGPAHAVEANYVEGSGKKEVGLKLHMGRNRVVRRMFEALGYEVVKLDRVVFAGLTKKDLPRGKWRHLSEKEVLFLTKRQKG